MLLLFAGLATGQEAPVVVDGSTPWASLGRAVALTVVAIVTTLIALMLMRRVRIHAVNWALTTLGSTPRRGQAAASLYEIFKGPLRLVVVLLLRTVFITIGLTILFAAFSYILGLYPATAGAAQRATQSTTQALATAIANVVAYLPNFFVLVILGAFTYIAIRAARALAEAIRDGMLEISGFYVEWATPTYELVRVLLILFALVVAFPYLPGGDSPAFKGISIFIGVLVSLGSGSAMANVIAGIILTYMRPFHLGDRVKIGDTIGEITEKSLLVTRIRSIKNVEVIVPNSTVLSTHVLNYSAMAKNRGLILRTTVTLGYDAPWRTVHDLLIRSALKTTFILAEPAPFVLQTSLNDFHITYEINAYTNEASQMMNIYSELHRNIQDGFNAAGVEIMSPTYLSLRDGNTVTIPEDKRPPGYTPPSFRVQTEPDGRHL
jgi:small-conductance mechanosensitive channel